MNLQEIRHLAGNQGIKPRKLNKSDLVRAIQRDEGNFDCFATAVKGECNQLDCMWREDCFSCARRN